VTPLQQAEATVADAQAQAQRIERDATTVSRLVWSAVILASLPPLFGVTQFAKAQGVSGWVAWVIDPSFIFVIAASIMAHESLSRHGEEKIGVWLHLVPWLAAGASLYLNIADSLHLDDKHPVDSGGVGVHGLPSLVTIFIIEAASSYRARIRGRLTAAQDVVFHADQALRALQAEAEQQAAEVAERERREQLVVAERQRAEREQRELAEQERQEQARQQDAAASERAAERAHALELARLAAANAAPSPSSAGSRQAPPTDSGPRRLTQDALDAIAREIAEQIRATPGWEPDYDRLQETYGRGRRWCEDRVSAARLLAGTPAGRAGSQTPRLHAVAAEA
jgi:hypothetical protein